MDCCDRYFYRCRNDARCNYRVIRHCVYCQSPSCHTKVGLLWLQLPRLGHFIEVDAPKLVFLAKYYFYIVTRKVNDSGSHLFVQRRREQSGSANTTNTSQIIRKTSLCIGWPTSIKISWCVVYLCGRKSLVELRNKRVIVVFLSFDDISDTSWLHRWVIISNLLWFMIGNLRERSRESLR